MKNLNVKLTVLDGETELISATNSLDNINQIEEITNVNMLHKILEVLLEEIKNK